MPPRPARSAEPAVVGQARSDGARDPRAHGDEARHLVWHPIERAGRAGERCAGERAAQIALVAAGGDWPSSGLARSPSGRPIWPRGMAGSIAHSGGHAVAVCSRTDAALGIDFELDAALHAADAEYVMCPAELAAIRADTHPDVRATLLWSAKESAFKALCHLLDDDLAGTDPLEWRVDAAVGAERFSVISPRGMVNGRWYRAGGYVLSLASIGYG